MTLLSINIPTYERWESFSKVLSNLAEEIGSLEQSRKDLVQINIIDNDSTCFLNKERLCKELAVQFDVSISFKKNICNIGGPLNVHNCYMASPKACFTWVLGDDDHVLKGSLDYITNILLEYREKLGLLILSAEGYGVHKDILKKQIFRSYSELALTSTSVQPHFLIAHTLISCNIFRTEVFIEEESLYAINSLYSRYGHWTGFSHMRGLLFGLLKSDYLVIVPNVNVLDTGRRVNDIDFGEQIFEMYYFHFIWLMSEIGVRIDQIKCDQTMLWLNGGIRFRIFLLGRRANLRERFKLLLIRLFGAKIFYGIRRVLRGGQL